VNADNNKKKNTDPRVTAKRSPWLEYMFVLAVMLCLTGGQAMIFNEFVELKNMPISFVLDNIGYWALMTLAFIFITAYMRKKVYVKPMQILSEAAKQVAEGDFSVYVPPLRKDGKKDYVDVMFEDFNKMVEELGSIETLKNDFIANVSHEIKTPLSVIQNYAEMLRKENLSFEDRKEYCDTIIVGTQRLTALVTNILKLNKLENQEILPSAEPYDLCRQLTECALAFENLWEAKNIEFTADLEDKVIIKSDEEIMSIVWHNLLSNAVKFTEPGGGITLTQTSDLETVTVIVSDTGCGMDKEVIGRIFDKFYQGDTSHSQEGNGLGLALTFRVIELAGGSITVKSEPGKGSEFIVTLPIAPA